MREHYAILKDHVVVSTDDLEEWGNHFMADNRILEKTEVGQSEVSTAFLGVNHQWGKGSPLWFETLVFGGPLAGEIERYTTWEEAKEGHQEMIKRVKRSQNRFWKLIGWLRR